MLLSPFQDMETVVLMLYTVQSKMKLPTQGHFDLVVGCLSESCLPRLKHFDILNQKHFFHK